jgi:hypothetical protein
MAMARRRHRRRSLHPGLTVLAVVIAAPLIAVAMIVVHEIGHTLGAWVMGDGHAYFIVYRRAVAPNGSVDTCVGCNMYDSAHMGPLANTFVSLAGVGATAALTWVAILLLRADRSPLPRWLLVEVALICWLGDAIWQVVQALPLGVPAREPVGVGLGYTDFSAAGSFFAQATGWSRGLVEALGLGAAAIYVAVTLAAVVAWGRRPRRPYPSRISPWLA